MKLKRINKTLNIIITLLLIAIGSIYAYKEIKILDKSTKEEEIVYKENSDNLEIYFFDVGQADSILLKQRDNNILIDAGNKLDAPKLKSFLKNDLKINKISMVVGTHPHEDHIGGMSEIIKEFPVDTILMPNVTSTSKTFENLLDTIDELNYKITVPKVNQIFDFDNLKLHIIYTGKNNKNLNDSSIIIKAEYLNNSFLFMGDASKKIEEKILKKDISSDVIKIGHHGSSYSTSISFLNKVNPKYAIIEVGKDNNYGHPNEVTLNSLKEKNIKTMRTDLDGTIKITSDGTNIKIDKMKTDLDG